MCILASAWLEESQGLLDSAFVSAKMGNEDVNTVSITVPAAFTKGNLKHGSLVKSGRQKELE